MATKRRKKYVHPEWYQKKRAMVEDAFKIGKPKRALSKTHISPGKKYVIETTPYEISPTGWDYCEARIYMHNVDRMVGTVLRNYGSFPKTWCLDHPDGNDYLFCGEDYQAITVVNLTTGNMSTVVDESVHKGAGFCQTGGIVSESRTKLALTGCEWGGPYGIVFYDISKPMEQPWKELGFFDGFFQYGDGQYEYDMDWEVIVWDDEDAVVVLAETKWMPDLNIPFDEYMSQEYEKDPENGIERAQDLWDSEGNVRMNSYAVKTDGTYEFLDTEWRKPS